MRLLSVVLAVASAWAQAPQRLNLIIVEGEGAINNIRQRTAREPIVQVEDENRRPISGAAVVFALPSNGAGGTFANGARTLTTVTDSQGRAVARGLRPNNVQGQYQIRVTASHQGQTATTSITQSNAVVTGAAGAGAGAAGGGISAKVIAIVAVVAGAAAAGGALYATRGGDGGSNSVPVPPTTISVGAGTVGPPR